MSRPQLQDRLDEMIRQARGHVDNLAESDPLKTWFQLELRSFAAPSGQGMELHELNARIRAVTQLNFLIHERRAATEAAGQKRRDDVLDESIGTLMARLPASVFSAVRDTNFSIEPAVLLTAAAASECFDPVSPTAKIVGYLRGLDESLAFARELCFAADARNALDRLGISAADTRAKMAVLFQARYHSINAAMAACQPHQILEIASGISPRGLQWSRSSPGTVYIESDLPILMKEKAKILRNLIDRDCGDRGGVLHCCAINALDLDNLRHALACTDPGCDLTIVTEGLLLYFAADEMCTFLQNMRAVLTERPQARWIVDMVSRTNLQELFDCDAEVASAVRKIFSHTGRSVVSANPFRTESCVEECIERHGLRRVAKLPLAEMTAVLPASSTISQDSMRSIVGSRAVWTIAAL
jgi:O-methyltransferase involved in polyketide biosynthesis